MLILLLLFLLFSLSYVGLILYYAISYRQIKNEVKLTHNLQPTTHFTVIIPARNEEENIAKCLQSILNNNYPTQLLQVIVVNDFSTDNTSPIVEGFLHKQIQLLHLKNYATTPLQAYKKKAIEYAITMANGSFIITTDADCVVPTNWLAAYDNTLQQTNAKFIAAPVNITYSNSFIEIFQSLDFMTLQGITATVVHNNQMTMCNGANMGYTKAAFLQVNGFSGIDDIASGDDMLLMHKIAAIYPTKIQFLNSKEAIVQTTPVHTISQFFNQRIRWASKADKYNDKRILPVLILVYFFNVLLILLPIICCFTNTTIVVSNHTIYVWQIWFAVLLSKIIAELIFLYPVASFFNNKKLLLFFPIMQPFHIVYTIIAGWLGKFGKYSWKGRLVK